ncbi:hypothetical protein ADIAL_1851 [Alkalibacterium sp. AK22]|uniref:DUF2922 domain-containing protein n=1 Tax=Alkalibacterium sp. AK22 TaxID=1229520 RepID=UPI000446C356|nr:DUF2922 domain-containing protein [Alkalibacterium sp. AK22]EXJ22736.1 hypothetical protein ADIAL_1851 [Alkalibacterium sp. AK22]
MSKKLEMQFITEEGKNRVIAVDQPKENLTASTVQTAMETIIAQDMFTMDGYKVFSSIKGARYVTRTVEDILEAE